MYSMKRLERIDTTCAGCGAIFPLKPYLAKKRTKRGRFCSMGCRSRFMATLNPATQPRPVLSACAHCHTEIKLKASKVRVINFCSHSCRGAYGCGKRWADHDGKTQVPCAQCNEPIALRTWQVRLKIARGQRQFFCDRDCFGKWKAENWRLENNPSWKGGWTPHGKGWNVICAEVREEQGHACAECGITEQQIRKALDVHHIIPARLFANRRDASYRKNLVGVCHPCHMRIENASGTISPCQPPS